MGNTFVLAAAAGAGLIIDLEDLGGTCLKSSLSSQSFHLEVELALASCHMPVDHRTAMPLLMSHWHASGQRQWLRPLREGHANGLLPCKNPIPKAHIKIQEQLITLSHFLVPVPGFLCFLPNVLK